MCKAEFSCFVGDPPLCSLACELRADEDFLDVIEALRSEHMSLKRQDLRDALEGLMDDLEVRG
jgi:hypothetical protein